MRAENSGRAASFWIVLVVSLLALQAADSQPAACDEDLGVANGLLSSQYITASSSYTAMDKIHPYSYYPGDARLNRTIGYGGWAPQSSSLREYWQVDFRKQVTVTSMAIQGFKPLRFESGKPRNVKSFNIYISVDGIQFTMVDPGVNQTAFTGTNTSIDSVAYAFHPPLKALFFRLSNFTTEAGVLPGIRVAVRGCDVPPVFAALQACSKPLGMQSGAIADSRISANSVYSSGYAAHYARLNRDLGYGGWCGRRPISPTFYITIDLGQNRLVSSIATQGIKDDSNGVEYFVTKYNLEYQQNNSSTVYYLAGYGFNNATGSPAAHPFTGSHDDDTVTRQWFFQPFLARYITLYNFSIEYYDDPCMRLEIYGCNATQVLPTWEPSVTPSSDPGKGTLAPTTTSSSQQGTATATAPGSSAATAAPGTGGVSSTGGSLSVVTVDPARTGQQGSGNPSQATSSGTAKSGTATSPGGGSASQSSSNTVAISIGVGAGALVVICVIVLLIILNRRKATADIRKNSASSTQSTHGLVRHQSSSSAYSTESSSTDGVVKMSGRMSDSVLYQSPTSPDVGTTQRTVDNALYQQPTQNGTIRYIQNPSSAAPAPADGQYASLDANVKPMLASGRPASGTLTGNVAAAASPEYSSPYTAPGQGNGRATAASRHVSLVSVQPRDLPASPESIYTMPTDPTRHYDSPTRQSGYENDDGAFPADRGSGTAKTRADGGYEVTGDGDDSTKGKTRADSGYEVTGDGDAYAHLREHPEKQHTNVYSRMSHAGGEAKRVSSAAVGQTEYDATRHSRSADVPDVIELAGYEQLSKAGDGGKMVMLTTAQATEAANANGGSNVAEVAQYSTLQRDDVDTTSPEYSRLQLQGPGTTTQAASVDV